MVKELLGKEPVKSIMEELRRYDHSTYEHSIRMAKITVLIMEEKRETHEKCAEAVLAALLHDIGVIKVEQGIVLNKGAYSSREYVQMKKHTEYGYELLGNYSSIPEIIRKVCLMHHERNNGNGYPQNINKSQLPELCQFIAFLEVFVALTTEKKYRRGYSYFEALSIIEGYSDNEFNLSYIPYIYKIYEIPRIHFMLEEKGRIG